MYKEIQGYDLWHNPEKVINILSDNAKSLSNDLYIIVQGNGYKLPKDVVETLKSLAKTIDKFTEI